MGGNNCNSYHFPILRVQQAWYAEAPEPGGYLGTAPVEPGRPFLGSLPASYSHARPREFHGRRDFAPDQVYAARMSPARLALRICPAALVACGSPGAAHNLSTGPGITSVSVGSTSEDASSTSAASSTSRDSSSTSGDAAASSTSAASTGAIYDLGTGGDVGPLQPPGCKDKIDFLFVMQREQQLPATQQKLIAAFPAFIDTIQAKFAGFDVHIMVVDTEWDWGQKSCEPNGCLATNNNGCNYFEDKIIPDYPCGVYWTLDECDRTLGAGTMFNAGLDAANVPCKLDGGNRYITQDQTDLKGTFACMAEVGQAGGFRVGRATVEAVSPKLNQDGGCNAGFVRDEALLMITFVATTGDDWSEGTPQDWAGAVFAAKQGNKDAVIMLGIGGDADDPETARLLQFIKLFPHSLRGYIDAPSYGAIFAEAVTLVDEACQGFTPPG